MLKILFGIGIKLILSLQILEHVVGRRHGTVILQRPDDVIGPECGDEIKLTCMAKRDRNDAEGSEDLDIEWWYRGFEETTTSAEKLDEKKRNGRVQVVTKTFYVVQSILTIQDAKGIDQGVYQCRASANPNRNNKGVNALHYWQIEEVPVAKVACDDMTSSKAIEVTSATLLNRSALNLERKTTMLSLMTSTKRRYVGDGSSRKTTPLVGAPKKQQKRSALTTTATGGTGSIHQNFQILVVLIVVHFLSTSVNLR